MGCKKTDPNKGLIRQGELFWLKEGGNFPIKFHFDCFTKSLRARNAKWPADKVTEEFLESVKALRPDDQIKAMSLFDGQENFVPFPNKFSGIVETKEPEEKTVEPVKEWKGVKEKRKKKIKIGETEGKKEAKDKTASKEEVQAKGKRKAKREEAKEGSSTPVKPKKHKQQDSSKTVIKGSGLEDMAHVVVDTSGTALEARLRQVTESLDKFYTLQLVKDSHSDQFSVIMNYGKTGSTGQFTIKTFDSLGEATRLFEKKFKEKTGVRFTEREDYTAVKGKYAMA